MPGGQVDQHIAAEDDVSVAYSFGQRVEQVVPIDRDPRPHFVVDPPELAGRHEMTGNPLSRQPAQLAVREARRFGAPQRGGRHVGGEHRPVDATLDKQHRQAVSLLAVGAARTPDPGGPVQCGQDVLGQNVELLRMAEEAALLDGHPVDQLLQPFRLSAQGVDIRVRRLTERERFVADAAMQPRSEG